VGVDHSNTPCASDAPLGLNPFVGVMLVYIDNDGRVIGWMYSKELVRMEDKASLK